MDAKVLSGAATIAIVIYVAIFFLNALFVQLCFNHLRERLELQVGEMDYWDAMVAQIFVMVLRGSSFTAAWVNQPDSSKGRPYDNRSRRAS